MATSSEANIWQPRQIINLSANTKQAEERFSASAGQQEFLLGNFTYAKDTGSLTVYRNGGLLSKWIDWVELSPDTGTDNEANSFRILTPCEVDDEVVALGLTEIRGDVAVSSGSVISPTPPAITENLKATRWWDCTTGRSYVLTNNSTGYKQWVEERSPINPPNFAVTTLYVEGTVIPINATLHSYMVVITDPGDVSCLVGRSLDDNGAGYGGALVFIRYDGTGTCTIVPDVADGVDIKSAFSFVLSAQYSTVALLSNTEFEWTLMGDLQVV